MISVFNKIKVHNKCRPTKFVIYNVPKSIGHYSAHCIPVIAYFGGQMHFYHDFVFKRCFDGIRVHINGIRLLKNVKLFRYAETNPSIESNELEWPSSPYLASQCSNFKLQMTIPHMQ